MYFDYGSFWVVMAKTLGVKFFSDKSFAMGPIKCHGKKNCIFVSHDVSLITLDWKKIFPESFKNMGFAWAKVD